jgi:hypothetical protein
VPQVALALVRRNEQLLVRLPSFEAAMRGAAPPASHARTVARPLLPALRFLRCQALLSLSLPRHGTPGRAAARVAHPPVGGVDVAVVVRAGITTAALEAYARIAACRSPQ